MAKYLRILAVMSQPTRTILKEILRNLNDLSYDNEIHNANLSGLSEEYDGLEKVSKNVDKRAEFNSKDNYINH